MRNTARLIALGAAILVIIFGMIQPIEHDSLWLAAVWAAAPLLLLAAHLSVHPLAASTQRSVRNLGVLLAIGFVLLSLQLMRQQFVRASEIANSVYTNEQTGQTTSNVRRVIDAMKIQRGKIYDRKGTLLVDTRVGVGGLTMRTYPYADIYRPTSLSNIVGFYSNRYGQSALESTYDSYLTGESDTFANIQNTLIGRPRIGDDLHLTIDADLQDAVTALLGDRPGSAIVLDPRTGAVLAMVSHPGFDPRGLATNPDVDSEMENGRVSAYWASINSDVAGQPLINRPTQGRYPPGSTWKTVTAIGALEHPAEGRPDQIDCPNERQTEAGAPPVVNAVPNLFNLTGNPTTLERVYAYSCNTAFAEYAMRLGPDLLADVSAKFDVFRPGDAPTTYANFPDLPTEPSLLYVDPGFLNQRPALADTGYGQGQMLVTPLQMAMIAASIANDGVLLQPYLVERVTRPDGGLVLPHSPRPIRRAMSSQVAATMRSDMRAGVVYGFGKAADAVPGVAVGGKSGTAEHGVGTRTHAWFIAIAPVEQPRFAVAVMLESGGEGSSQGAKLAGEVMAAAFATIQEGP